MRRVMLVLGLLLGCVACAANIPEGRFECDENVDCPPDLVCRTSVRRCYINADGGIDGG